MKQLKMFGNLKTIYSNFHYLSAQSALVQTSIGSNRR